MLSYVNESTDYYSIIRKANHLNDSDCASLNLKFQIWGKTNPEDYIFVALEEYLVFISCVQISIVFILLINV